jgi:hypothetical protein
MSRPNAFLAPRGPTSNASAAACSSNGSMPAPTSERQSGCCLPGSMTANYHRRHTRLAGSPEDPHRSILLHGVPVMHCPERFCLLHQRSAVGRGRGRGGFGLIAVHGFSLGQDGIT